MLFSRFVNIYADIQLSLNINVRNRALGPIGLFAAALHIKNS